MSPSAHLDLFIEQLKLLTPWSNNWTPLYIYATMGDIVEKSYPYDTSPGPDLEKHPHQANSSNDEESQPRIRHGIFKEKEDNNDSILEYGEEQDARALYQPMCGIEISSQLRAHVNPYY